MPDDIHVTIENLSGGDVTVNSSSKLAITQAGMHLRVLPNQRKFFDPGPQQFYNPGNLA
jgi:hypothetical protein